MKELLGRRGSQRSSVGVVLGVRSPTSSASGEAVEPKIVAEAKIGTYKRAELGLKPAAWPCCPASWARKPLNLGWAPFPSLFPLTFRYHNWAKLCKHGILCLRPFCASGFPREMGDLGGRKELQREWV